MKLKPETPQALTRKQLAAALKCDLRTIARWADEGLPTVRRGRGGRPSLFDLAAVQAWKAQRDTVAAASPDLANARARKEHWQALEAEQRVAIKAKTLLLAADVERWVTDAFARCRTKMLGLSRKAKALAPHLSVQDVAMIDTLIREALDDLAGPRA